MKNFSIVRNWKIFFAITIIGLMIGYGSMIFRGFNLGIDFTGGSIMDLKFEKAVQVAQVREVLGKHNLGGAIIQLESNDSAATSSQGVLIRTPVIADNDRTTVMQDMEKSLGKFEIRRDPAGGHRDLPVLGADGVVYYHPVPAEFCAGGHHRFDHRRVGYAELVLPAAAGN